MTVWDAAASEAAWREAFPGDTGLWNRLYPLQRADMARLAILYLHGGFYVDIDCYNDRKISIDSFLESVKYIAGEHQNGMTMIIVNRVCQHRTTVVFSTGLKTGKDVKRLHDRAAFKISESNAIGNHMIGSAAKSALIGRVVEVAKVRAVDMLWPTTLTMP